MSLVEKRLRDYRGITGELELQLKLEKEEALEKFFQNIRILHKRVNVLLETAKEEAKEEPDLKNVIKEMEKLVFIFNGVKEINEENFADVRERILDEIDRVELAFDLLPSRSGEIFILYDEFQHQVTLFMARTEAYSIRIELGKEENLDKIEEKHSEFLRKLNEGSSKVDKLFQKISGKKNEMSEDFNQSLSGIKNTFRGIFDVKRKRDFTGGDQPNAPTSRPE